MKSEGSSGASVVIQRRIEWDDIDVSQHWHYVAAFRLFDAAELVLMGRLGMLELHGGMPRRHLSAEFLVPLYLNDIVEVSLSVVTVGNTSLTYEFVVRKGVITCAKGSLVAVHVDAETRRPLLWPEEFRKLLSTAGPQPSELIVEGQPITPQE